MTTPRALLLRSRVRLREAELRRADDPDARVKHLIALGGAALAALVVRLTDGTLSKAAFIAQATALLAEHGAAAGGIGAGVYGAAADFAGLAEDAFTADAAGFADTVTDGSGSAAQLAAWAVGLAGVIWPVYQQGRWQGGAAVGISQWDWALDPAVQQHCASPDGQDCPTFAANGPYTAETKPADPGDGTTPCSANCRCGWQAHTGDTEA